MRFMFIPFFALLALSCSHQMTSPYGSCTRVRECLDIASKLTGKMYFFTNMKLDEKIDRSMSDTWTKENADYFIGEILSDTGYFRLHTPKENTYKLIYARDIRYESNVHSYNATMETNDPLPPANSAEPAELVYKSKNLHRVGEMARNLRPFVSRYGRVIDVTASQLLILRDTTTAIHQLLPLIRKMDVPMSAGEMKHLKDLKHMMMEKAKSSPPEKTSN